MNIVLFTPAIVTSAIGRMASLVTRVLARNGHEVSVVRTESESLLHRKAHHFDAQLIAWNDSVSVSSRVRSADVLVYQIGDNYEFHCGSLEWLPLWPGIVCLHDFFVGHLFFGWSQGRRRQADATLRAWYGEDVARRFFSYESSEGFIEGVRNASPMTEWICSMAHGVVTHSGWGIERVLNSCPGAVYVVPLPFDAPQIASTDNRSKGDEFRILTIGHINPNKRVASVIRAIGKSPLLRQCSVYRLVGYIHPEAARTLSTLAADCGVSIVISGDVDNITLAHAIEQADVVSCLRWPSLEAASASAVEAMLYGKATIVTNAGFYRELPDEVVKKIDPAREIPDIRAALEQLLVDSNARCALGTRAKAWAEFTFTPENYAEKLVEIGVSSNRSKPMIATANYFTGLLTGWGASEDLMSLEDSIGPLRLFDDM